MPQKHILIADDDPHICDVISFALENAGMKVTIAHDGAQAVAQFTQQPNNNAPFDLIVLDINMPEMDGLEVCREIRKGSEIPILFLSSRDEEIDRILGLELGGDDYVTKPFSPRELVARINAILKRIRAPVAETNTKPDNKRLQHGLLTMDIEQHDIRWNGQSIALTATEFAIVAQFMRAPSKVFSRNAIMDGAYQYNIHVSDRTIDSHIRHIRAKFTQAGCEAVIDTLHGVGYRLSKP